MTVSIAYGSVICEKAQRCNMQQTRDLAYIQGCSLSCPTQAVGDQLIDSIVGDNIPIFAEQERYNETVSSSVARVNAALEGRAVPGVHDKGVVLPSDACFQRKWGLPVPHEACGVKSADLRTSVAQTHLNATSRRGSERTRRRARPRSPRA